MTLGAANTQFVIRTLEGPAEGSAINLLNAFDEPQKPSR